MRQLILHTLKQVIAPLISHQTVTVGMKKQDLTTVHAFRLLLKG